MTFQYTGSGQIAQLTDPLGRTVRYAYDGSGRLATVTNPRDAEKGTGYFLWGKRGTGWISGWVSE